MGVSQISCERPTSESAASSAHTISVAAGRRETIWGVIESDVLRVAGRTDSFIGVTENDRLLFWLKTKSSTLRRDILVGKFIYSKN